jgi:hypothetical protein
MKKAEVVTIYYGADTEASEAEGINSTIAKKYPRLQVELIRGGQPHYNYIISIE